MEELVRYITDLAQGLVSALVYVEQCVLAISDYVPMFCGPAFGTIIIAGASVALVLKVAGR